MKIEQRQAHDRILQSVVEKRGDLFFLNGPGGTGKSFTWNTLAHSIRAQGLIVLCVASSGIASLLLAGGRTSHNMFVIPLEIKDEMICKVSRGTDKAELFKKVSLIIWDEVPMQDRRAIEAVDRMLRDVLDRPDEAFGGITMAWGGDFQQTLPVVPKGSKEDIIAACIQRSFLWHKVKVLHLKENMRVDPADPSSVEFAKWLLDIGQGKNLSGDGSFTVPSHMICGPEVSDLVQTIYPGIEQGLSLPDDYFLNRGILCPRNSDVDEINQAMIELFPGVEQIYHSADKIKDSTDDIYPVEYLKSISLGGLPPSELKVKVGAPLMVLRNINPGLGLCNGTRVRLIRKRQRVLEVKIISGPGIVVGCLI
jgi:hypothetical protein